MVDLHAGVDSDSTVLVEVVPGFLTSGKHDADIIYYEYSY